MTPLYGLGNNHLSQRFTCVRLQVVASGDFDEGGVAEEVDVLVGDGGGDDGVVGASDDLGRGVDVGQEWGRVWL